MYILRGHRIHLKNIIPSPKSRFCLSKQCRHWLNAALCGILQVSGSSLFAKIQFPVYKGLTLKVPITTAADDNFCDIFPSFRQIRYDISWESSASRRFSWIIMPYLLFSKKQKNWICRLLQVIGGAFRVNDSSGFICNWIKETETQMHFSFFFVWSFVFWCIFPYILIQKNVCEYDQEYLNHKLQTNPRHRD